MLKKIKKRFLIFILSIINIIFMPNILVLLVDVQYFFCYNARLLINDLET